MLIIYMFIGLYALLTGLAGIQQWRDRGFHIWYLLFIIISLSMLVTMFLQNKGFVFTLLLFEFVLLHILAIAEGMITNGKLKYNHHIIRFIFHCIILTMVYKFMM